MYRFLYPIKWIFQALELVIWIPYWLLGEVFNTIFETENRIDREIDKRKAQRRGIGTVYTRSK